MKLKERWKKEKKENLFYYVLNIWCLYIYKMYYMYVVIGIDIVM